VLATVVVFAGSVTTAQASSSGLGWANEYDLGNYFEAHGFTYNGRHHDVDFGFCSGLRRYGVREAAYDDYFHVFNCDANTANGEFWTLRVKILAGNRISIPNAHKDF